MNGTTIIYVNTASYGYSTWIEMNGKQINIEKRAIHSMQKMDAVVINCFEIDYLTIQSSLYKKSLVGTIKSGSHRERLHTKAMIWKSSNMEAFSALNIRIFQY